MRPSSPPATEPGMLLRSTAPYGNTSLAQQGQTDSGFGGFGRSGRYHHIFLVLLARQLWRVHVLKVHCRRAAAESCCQYRDAGKYTITHIRRGRGNGLGGRPRMVLGVELTPA